MGSTDSQEEAPFSLDKETMQNGKIRAETFYPANAMYCKSAGKRGVSSDCLETSH